VRIHSINSYITVKFVVVNHHNGIITECVFIVTILFLRSAILLKRLEEDMHWIDSGFSWMGLDTATDGIVLVACPTAL